jgi:hypothetical protein
MTGEILRLKPDQVISEIRQGTIEVVSVLKPVEQPEAEPGGIEKAKRIFGENFLGPDAIHVMETILKTNGVDVKFEIPTTTFPYTGSDIEKAKQDDSKGTPRMVVLRPEWMIVREGGKDIRKPVNILNLRDLFKKDDRFGSDRISYEFNPFGEGAVFCLQDWYDNEDFAKRPLKAGYAIPTKDILFDSIDTTWNDQQALLEPGERRREANEAVWDTILYYASTYKKIMEHPNDWTNSRTSDGSIVSVGDFDSRGLALRSWSPWYSEGALGVCPSL